MRRPVLLTRLVVSACACAVLPAVAEGHDRDYPTIVRSTTNLESYWRFEEESSPAVLDETGAAPATARSEVTFGLPGLFRPAGGRALGFEGADPDDVRESRVVVDQPGLYAFPGRASFAAETWVRPTLLDGGSRRILSMEDAGGGWLLAARSDATVAARFTLAPGSSAPAPGADPPVTTDWDTVSGPVLRLDRWSHVVINYNGWNLRLYVNGRRVSTVRSRQELGPRPGVALTIGSKTSAFLEWSGLIDEVSIYDHALSYRQVKEHYRAARTR